MLDVTKIRAHTLRMQKQRLHMFSVVLQKCHLKMKHVSSMRYTSVIYEVPRRVYGSPSFPYQHLVNYLVVNLRENGFVVTEMPSTLWTNLTRLHISWHPDVIRVAEYSKLIDSSKKKEERAPGLGKIDTVEARKASFL